MTHQIFFRQYNADRLTPVSVYSLIKSHFATSILCESVEKAAGRGRYSIIACNPDAIWEYDANNHAKLSLYDEQGNLIETQYSGNPLALLKALYANTQCPIPAPLPAAAAGLFGYFAYDAIGLIEELPPANADTINIPDGYLIRPRIVIIFDSVYDSLYVVTNTFSDTVNEQTSNDIINQRLDFIENIISKPCHLLIQEPPQNETIDFAKITYHQTKESFLDNVKIAQEYIRAGDAFQIVLSQRLSMSFYNDYFEFYRSLRRLNPSPYMFYFNHTDFSLAGASPEILVRNENGTITIRPIAGTRPRGATPEQDKQLESELLNDPKEISEHLMLLDLGRNDVGRISEIGTVIVTDEYMVERYSHVMHIVSNVTGQLKEGCDFIDAFFSALPAGTVSGAPKIRAMEIINELETEKRGFYAGGIGYFSSNGNGDFSIMLRTSLLKDNKIYFQAGAGVVADSIPINEYDETINKAKATIKAAQIASHGNG
jgi:anthranilate synthase component I